MKAPLEKRADLIGEAIKILESIIENENPRTEREFKNDDFHIKVWETEEEIGAETIFVREDFHYSSTMFLVKSNMGICKGYKTHLFSACLADFGMRKTIFTTKKSEIRGYTFQDIVKALETAHNESLKAHSKEVRTEKEFKNEDFHIKIWETEEEIGAETIFVRECFSYSSKKLLNNWSMAIEPFLRTQIYYNSLPNFGMDTTIHIFKKSGIRGYTFKDIVEELETAHNESLNAHNKEVTIEDVIKELGNVDTVTERLEILSKYEVRCILSNGTLSTWHSLRDNFGMLEPQLFYELGFYGVRRKEGWNEPRI